LTKESIENSLSSKNIGSLIRVLSSQTNLKIMALPSTGDSHPREIQIS